MLRDRTDGSGCAEIGEPQAVTRNPDAGHGVRCSPFSCNTMAGTEGGHAKVDSLVVATGFAGPAES